MFQLIFISTNFYLKMVTVIRSVDENCYSNRFSSWSMKNILLTITQLIYKRIIFKLGQVDASSQKLSYEDFVAMETWLLRQQKIVTYFLLFQDKSHILGVY